MRCIRINYTKFNFFICDVIRDFLSLQKIITQYTGLFTQRNHYCFPNEASSLSCDIFTSVMGKVRDLVFLQEGSLTYSPNATATSQIKWFICDVIPDYHVIGGRRNRTSNPRERIFPSIWSESSVIWYIYIIDEKGKRFGLVARRIPYLTDSFTKHHCRRVLVSVKFGCFFTEQVFTLPL